MSSAFKIRGHKRLSKVVGLVLFSMLLPTTPLAFAEAPAISAKWSIGFGAQSPVVYIDGANFASDNDKFDFTVDVGKTGLEYDSVAFVNVSLMRFTFHESAKAGIITIQANPSAFSPTASQASNIISIVVPEPLTPQVITFVNPTNMAVKDSDQLPKVTATSGLSVSLTSNTPSVCTIDFLKFHAVAPGTCSITATQNGDLKFAPANPVTKTFIVSALPTVPTLPTTPEDVVTHLGSVAYDPENASKTYLSVLIAADDKIHEHATLVKLLVPPKATTSPVVFVVSSFSSDKENSDGYFVARVKLVAADGSVVPKINGVIELVLPAGAPDAVPAWSFDSRTWYKLSKLDTEVLPPDLHAGYFVEKDGRIAILTDYLMLFGFRKIQSQLKIYSPFLLIKPNQQVQIQRTGGSGDGEVVYTSRTPEICSIDATGALMGVAAGKCIISARKSASGVYLNAISSSITLYVNTSSAQTLANDPNRSYSDLCHQLSYSVEKASSLVLVNLCGEDARKIATLEVGTKSKSGTWSYSLVKKQKLDDNGLGQFNLEYRLKDGQILRVKVDGKSRISRTVNIN